MKNSENLPTRNRIRCWLKFDLFFFRAFKLSSLFCYLFITLTLLSGAHEAHAQPNGQEAQLYGPGVIFNENPGAYLLVGEIAENDFFSIRRYIRENEVDYFVLSSPGGSVWDALQIAAMVRDLEIPVLVPRNATCASACSFIFFGGSPRFAEGALGVHQFSSNEGSGNETSAQFAASEIISFLNEFNTPPFVYERMFRTQELYFFNEDELTQLSTVPLRVVSEQVQEAEILLDRLFNILATLSEEETSEESPSDDTPGPSVFRQNPDVNIIQGTPPIMPLPRPTSIEAIPVFIENQTQLNRLRLLISIATASFEQPSMSFFRGYYHISQQDAQTVVEWVQDTIPGYPISYENFQIEIYPLISDEEIPLIVAPSMADLFGEALTNIEFHNNWVSGVYQNSPTTCFIYSSGQFEGLSDDFVAPPGIGLISHRIRGQSYLAFGIPLPSVLRERAMRLFVDGRLVPHTISHRRFLNESANAYTIYPRSVGDNLLSAEIVRRFRDGRVATVAGFNRMTGDEAYLNFSLYGFTAAFTRMMELCNAPELRGWIRN